MIIWWLFNVLLLKLFDFNLFYHLSLTVKIYEEKP